MHPVFLGAAVGCILAELLGRKPLFPGACCCPAGCFARLCLLCWSAVVGASAAARLDASSLVAPVSTMLAWMPADVAGKDFVHQLNMICKVIGTPTGPELAAVPNDKARAYLASMPYFPKQGEHKWHNCLPATTLAAAGEL